MTRWPMAASLRPQWWLPAHASRAISVGVMRAKKTADIGTAKTACSSIKSAVILWKNAHPDQDCPEVEALKHEKFLWAAGAGPYDGAARPDAVLAERIEGLVSQEHSAWTSSQKEAGRAHAG